MKKQNIYLCKRLEPRLCQAGNYDALRIPLTDPSLVHKISAKNICNLGVPYLTNILELEWRERNNIAKALAQASKDPKQVKKAQQEKEEKFKKKATL